MRNTKIKEFSNRLVHENWVRRRAIISTTKALSNRGTVANAYSDGYRDALLEAALVIAEMMHDDELYQDRVGFEAAVHTVFNHTAWHLR